MLRRVFYQTRKVQNPLATFSQCRSFVSSKRNNKFNVRRGAVRGLILTGIVGAIGIFSYESIKKTKNEAIEMKSVGRAAIGGPFLLVDHNGKPRSDLSYLEKFRLVYFGFTYCPDICPTELTKMGRVLDGLEEKGQIDKIVPMMISVDPWRDTVGQIRGYVNQFHPRLIGLTGTPEQVMEACKSYRIYASKPPDEDEDDYLVDHSVFMFLMDPEGFYVAHYGPDKDEDQILEQIEWQIRKYEEKFERVGIFTRLWRKWTDGAPPQA